MSLPLTITHTMTLSLAAVHLLVHSLLCLYPLIVNELLTRQSFHTCIINLDRTFKRCFYGTTVDANSKFKKQFLT